MALLADSSQNLKVDVSDVFHDEQNNSQGQRYPPRAASA
jgi:hypothetical protein